MSIKGFLVNGNVEQYDYESLANKPTTTGLSDEAKQALLACFENVAWINANGQTYYDALEAALYPTGFYSVTNVLTNCTTSNSTATVADGGAYSATITADSGYTLEGAAVSITMGGTAVTGYYNNGTISIPSVTGDLVITVTATSAVTSISAVFTQGSTVIYDTDGLTTLRQYLVVTATYADSTTAVVTDYTLSGTLAAGTSTITASYGGQTDTFTVTVTHSSVTMLFNWDFTQSLTDSVAGRTVNLNAANGTDAPARTSSGIVFNDATQRAYFGTIDMTGKTIEIDVASFAFAGDSSYHVRFLMNAYGTASNAVGAGALIYRSGYGWSAYGYSDSDSDHSAAGYRKWSSTGWGSLHSTSGTIDSFNGKTVKVVYDADGHTRSLYLDDTLIATMTDLYFNHDSNYIFIGGINSYTQANGDQCYNMTVSGVRIYTNE